MQDIPKLQRSIKLRILQRLRSASVATNAALLFANSLLGAFLGLMFWPIAAHFYDLASIGLTSAVVSAATLIATTSNLGFGAVVIRYLPVSGDSELRLSVTATLVPATVAGAGAIIFSQLPVGQALTTGGIPGAPTPALLVLLAVVIAASALQDSIFIARRQGALVLMTDLGGSVVRFMLLVPLARLGAFGLVSTFTVGSAIAVMLGASAWRKKLEPHPSPLASLRQMAAYGATNYASGLLSQVPQLLFPIFIATQVSHTAAGAFNFAWLAAALLMTLPPAAANVLLSHLVSDPASVQRHLRRTALGIIVTTAVLACSTYIAAWILIPLILPAGAHEALLFLPLLLVGVVLFAIVRLHSMILAWRGNLFELLVLNGFVASMAIGLPLILLPRAGVLGLEVGWLISQFLGAIVGQVIQARFSKGLPYA